MNEVLMTLNNFNTPIVLKDKDAVFALLVRLIMLEPGTIQDHPKMGVGIVSRYRYSNTKSLPELERDISAQIGAYLPELQGVKVSTSTSGKNLILDIAANDTVYRLSMDTDTYTLNNI